MVNYLETCSGKICPPHSPILGKEGYKQRDSYWDTLKFILIFMVVFDHCLMVYRPDGGINRALSNSFITIVMPIFIFVSGLFSKMKDRENYKHAILRIFETYVVFQTIRVGIKIIPGLMHDTVSLKSIAIAFLKPQLALWYLLCLCYWRVLILYIPQKLLNNHPREILIVSFLISLLGGFIPVGASLTPHRAMTFIPFFFLGYYANANEVKKYIAKFPLSLSIGVLLLCFLLYLFVLNYDIKLIVCGNTSYWSVEGFSPLELFIARVILLISVTITSLAVMRLVPTKHTIFSQWGRITLFIYIYHTFAIDILRFIFKHNYLPHSEWPLIVSPVIITMVLISLSQIKFLNILLNPISYLISLKTDSNRKV